MMLVSNEAFAHYYIRTGKSIATTTFAEITDAVLASED